MADRDTGTGESADREEGFVFGEDRAGASSPSADDGERADASATTVDDTSTLTTTAVGAVAVLVLLIAGVQLFGPGVAAVLDGGGGGSATPIDVATTEMPDGETTAPARETDDALATPPSDGDATDGGGTPSAGDPGGGGDTAGSDDRAGSGDTIAGDPGGDGTTAGDSNAQTGTPDGADGDAGGMSGGDGTTSDGADGGGGGGGFVQTDTGEGGPPVIESVSVIDDSQAGGSGGTLVYQVGWTITDPDGNLDQVTVTVVANPDGDATTLSRRPLQIGGARNQTSTTFQAPIDSLGTPYEVRVVAEDQFGNSVNVTRREVANGEPD